MKHSLKVTLILMAIFLLAQYIGLGVTSRYIDWEATEATGEFTAKELPSYGGIRFERPEAEGVSLVSYIIGAIFIGTMLLLALIRFKRVSLWKFWFFFAVALCLTFSFAAFIDKTAALVLALLLAYFKVWRPQIIIQNFTELFMYGGLASIFVLIKGMTIPVVIILLLLISLYDMYAVWKSKHMIKLAKFQTKAKVFAGVLIPYQFPKLGAGGIKKVKAGTRAKAGTKVSKKIKEQEVRTAILGGGDIGFPLIFAGVVMKTVGFHKALIIPLIVAIPLFILFMKGQKGKFYPAMPFITIGCLAAYGAILLLNLI
jgi:presenilin-like A22 family membrane protease